MCRGFLTGVVAAGFLASLSAMADRYEDLTRWAADGPKLDVQAATFLGTASPETVVDAVVLPDRSVAVAGNAYGPAFFTTVSPRILGRGSHSGADPFTTLDHRRALKAYTPDMCGMLVLLTPDLQKVRQVTRFQWGVATISAVALSQDRKALILAGHCKPEAMKDVAPEAVLKVSPPVVPAHAAPLKPRTKDAPTAAYVLRLAVGDAARVEWCWVLQGVSRAPEALWQDRMGTVSFALDGYMQIPADGSSIRKLTSQGNLGGQSGFRGFDPMDGGFFYGGDRSTHTGQQSWRQPFLHKQAPAGDKAWSLWGWDPKACACGGRGNGLCANTSVRDVQVAPNGDLMVLGWSDGANSVFTRQPYALEQMAGNPSGPFAFQGVDAGASMAYVLKLDGVSRAQTAWATFMVCPPDGTASAIPGGRPAGVQVSRLRLLGDGAIALAGDASAGLIRTPGSMPVQKGFVPYGGRFVSVLRADFSQMLYSSYLPGYETVTLTPVDGGVIIAGTARRDDGRTDTAPAAPPLKSPLQPQHAGGVFDVHLMLLGSPRAQ